jgi:hypothetical protein
MHWPNVKIVLETVALDSRHCWTNARIEEFFSSVAESKTNVMCSLWHTTPIYRRTDKSREGEPKIEYNSIFSETFPNLNEISRYIGVVTAVSCYNWL